MRIAFFLSSIGDTDLALRTIESMEGEHQVSIIALTKVAQQRIENFSSPLLHSKKSLPEILHLGPELFPKDVCDSDQIKAIVESIHSDAIDQVYCGVPSVNNQIPFQIAVALDKIPVLMAYEFMFKPESHCMWDYVRPLNKPNVKWALPLDSAKDDFHPDQNVSIIGHLSIDNAFSAVSLVSTSQEIREQLDVLTNQPLAFVSGTTQPVDIDKSFLDGLLTELPKHPDVRVRLGLHPGIQELDSYLAEVLSVAQAHPEAANQFKIIFPDNLRSRLKSPELSIDNPMFQHVFLKRNITGSEASAAADRVGQAVPGALLNQAVLEGKSAFAPQGKPYLPKEYFADSASRFFSEMRKPPLKNSDLGLDEKTAGERCAAILLGS